MKTYCNVSKGNLEKNPTIRQNESHIIQLSDIRCRPVTPGHNKLKYRRENVSKRKANTLGCCCIFTQKKPMSKEHCVSNYHFMKNANYSNAVAGVEQLEPQPEGTDINPEQKEKKSKKKKGKSDPSEELILPPSIEPEIPKVIEKVEPKAQPSVNDETKAQQKNIRNRRSRGRRGRKDPLEENENDKPPDGAEDESEMKRNNKRSKGRRGRKGPLEENDNDEPPDDAKDTTKTQKPESLNRRSRRNRGRRVPLKGTKNDDESGKRQSNSRRKNGNTKDQAKETKKDKNADDENEKDDDNEIEKSEKKSKHKINDKKKHPPPEKKKKDNIKSFFHKEHDNETKYDFDEKYAEFYTDLFKKYYKLVEVEPKHQLDKEKHHKSHHDHHKSDKHVNYENFTYAGAIEHIRKHQNDMEEVKCMEELAKIDALNKRHLHDKIEKEEQLRQHGKDFDSNKMIINALHSDRRTQAAISHQREMVRLQFQNMQNKHAEEKAFKQLKMLEAEQLAKTKDQLIFLQQKAKQNVQDVANWQLERDMIHNYECDKLFTATKQIAELRSQQKSYVESTLTELASKKMEHMQKHRELNEAFRDPYRLQAIGLHGAIQTWEAVIDAQLAQKEAPNSRPKVSVEPDNQVIAWDPLCAAALKTKVSQHI